MTYETAKYATYCYDLAKNRKAKYITKINNFKVRITVVFYNNGCWRVSNIVNEHNRDLLSAISRPMADHRSVKNR